MYETKGVVEHGKETMFFPHICRLSTVRSRSGPATLEDPGPGLVLDLDPWSGPGPIRVWTQTPVLQCNYYFF